MTYYKNRRKKRRQQRILICSILLCILLLLTILFVVLLTHKPSLNPSNPIDSGNGSTLTESMSSTESQTVTETPSDEDLVVISDYIPDAVIDLRYATTNNFTKNVIYDDDFQAQLRYGTLKKLIAAANTLREQGYRIRIYDAYRPVEAQYKLFQHYPVPGFVASPITGNSRHSRGSTIDLSIVRIDGSTVTMPSEFDDFSAKADRTYDDVSEEAKANSMILEKAMTDAGFSPYNMEWWHYNDLDDYPVIEREQYSWVDNLKISNSANQILVIASKNTNKAVLSLHTKSSNGTWNQELICDGYLGSNGIGKTKEGDKKTPVGIYKFTKAFGKKENPGCTAFPYLQVDNSHYWVDDSNSIYYNQFVDTDEVPVDWTSAEHLIDIDVYDYVLSINYNEECTPGLGSAIFLHCSADRNTNGCIAISSDMMKELMKKITSDCIILIDSPDQIIQY